MRINYKRKNKFFGKFLIFASLILVMGGGALFANFLLHNASAEDNENIEKVWEVPESDSNVYYNVYDLKAAFDGGFVVAGSAGKNDPVQQQAVEDTGASLLKYDADGNLEWHVIHHDTSLSHFTSVLPLSNTEYMAVGWNSTDPDEGIVSRFEVNGDTVTETETWHYVYDSGRTILTGIILDSDNNFVISGITGSKLFFVKLKSSHSCSIAQGGICEEDLMWTKEYTNTGNPPSNIYQLTNRILKVGNGEFVVVDNINNDYGGTLTRLKESEAGNSVEEVWKGPSILIGADSALEGEYLEFSHYFTRWNIPGSARERYLKGGFYAVGNGSNDAPSDWIIGSRAIPTIDNEYLVLGEYLKSNHGMADLIKVDSNGKILWENREDAGEVDNYWVSGISNGDGTYIVISNTGMIRKYRDKTTYNWIRYNIVTDADPEYRDLADYGYEEHYFYAMCGRPGRTSAKLGTTLTLESMYSEGCTSEYIDYNFYDGYEFDGWYTDSELTIPFEGTSITANQNIDLYGAYEKLQYEIPFLVVTDENDGTEPVVSQNSTQTLTRDDTVNLPNINVPEGYEFDGWYGGTIVDGERVYGTTNKFTQDFVFGPEYISSTAATHFDFLYAKVTKKKTFEIPFYTVTYEEEGGTPAAVADSVQSGYVGDTITLPTVEVPEDYEMKGWFGGNIVEGEPAYNTTKQFTEDFVYSESEIGQYDFIYAKIVKKPVYHVPFYLVVYEDTNYTTIKEVVEIEGAKNDYRIGDYLEFPSFNTTKYSRQNNYWYGGKVVDGEKVYNSSPSLYQRTDYYTYTQNYVTQFDFLYARVTLNTIQVRFNMKDDYSYYDGNGNWTQAHYCGDYSSEMTTYPNETILWGSTIATEIKTASPDGSCVLGSLKLSSSSSGGGSDAVDFTPDMPIETSYYGYIYIVGKYTPNYLIVRDDKVYYASGEEYDVETDENLFWNPETNTLTLENYTTMDILFANGEEPINLVLNGTNDTQIRSSTTPIVISGTGSLANATPLQGSDTAYAAIDANGTSIVMESGKIKNNIFAENVMINGGEASENIIVCYGNGYDEASCGAVVNGGNISSIRAFYGDIYIYDGLFKIGSSIEAEDGDLVIESGIFNSSGFEGGRIIINGGSISGMSNVETEVFMMNGGNIDVTIPDRFRVENYFIMNDGVLKVKAVSEDPAIYVRNGYAIFNGGTADIAGVVPMTVDYPGAFEEELATAGMELNEETIAELKARLGDYLPTRGAGVEINGGDVTFGTVKKDELIDLAVDAYMAGFEEDMMSNMPSTDEEVAEICLDAEEGDMVFSHYKTWRIDISGLTLVPMDDGEGGQVMLPELDINTGDALTDEEGNPIFIPLYNAVDEEGNVVYAKVGQGVDENGNTFYFKAGFSDENDCKNNFLTVYPDLMRLYYRDYMRQRAESEFADVQEYPMAFMLGKNGSDDIIDESAIYINPELFKDPEVIEISPITVSGEDSTQYFVTFGDGEGEPSFDPEAITSEHLLTKARFYERKQDITYHWQNDKDEYEANSDDTELKLIIDVDFDHFDHKVEVDGKEIIAGTDYEAVSGSTEITLKKDYLNSLATGEHEIKVYFANMSQYNDTQVSTTFTIKKESAPKPVNPDDEGKNDNTANIPDTSGGTEEKTGDHGIMNREQSFVALSLAGTVAIVSLISGIILRKRKKTN